MESKLIGLESWIWIHQNLSLLHIIENVYKYNWLKKTRRKYTNILRVVFKCWEIFCSFQIFYNGHRSFLGIQKEIFLQWRPHILKIKVMYARSSKGKFSQRTNNEKHTLFFTPLSVLPPKSTH